MAYDKVEKYINSDIHSNGFWKNDETNLNAANMNSLTEGVNAVAEAISGDGGLDSRVKENENFIAANESNIRDISNIRDRLNNESKNITEQGNRISAHEEQYGKNRLDLGGSAVVIQNKNGTAEIAGSVSAEVSTKIIGNLHVSASTTQDGDIKANSIEASGNISSDKDIEAKGNVKADSINLPGNSTIKDKDGTVILEGGNSATRVEGTLDVGKSDDYDSYDDSIILNSESGLISSRDLHSENASIENQLEAGSITTHGIRVWRDDLDEPVDHIIGSDIGIKEITEDSLDVIS